MERQRKLKKEPQNLLIRLQMIESGIREEDYLDILRKAVALVRRKPAGWDIFGPPIVRYAVVVAKDRKLSEFQKWADMACQWFPNSYYTRIDVAAQLMAAAYEKDNYPDCVRLGEGLMAAYADFRAGRGDMDCQMYSTLHLSSPYHEQLFRLMAANSCLEAAMTEEAASLLEELDYSQLDGSQAGNLAKILCSLHSKSDIDTKKLVLSAWKGITAFTPSEKRAEERRLNFMLNGSAAFTPGYRQEERRKGLRPAYPAFAPLAGECGLGTAAAVMGSESPAEIAALLETVEKWNELPFPALSHAMRHKITFPLPDKPLCMEEMDNLARRLAGDRDDLFSLIGQIQGQDLPAEWQPLAWTQMLVLAAVQNCYWEDEPQGMALARVFVRVEQEFLSRYYTSEVLKEENLLILPEIHRFGWYCVQAFDALDKGDVIGYTHLLRKGLTAHEAMKPMVEFLTEHTPELQVQEPDPELLDLAGKVRDLLALYPQDDPAVVAIKASDVYKRVAHLIEEP